MTTAELLSTMKAASVTAKARKRCPTCHKMVEAGDAAVLRDNRRVVNYGPHQGQSWVRGAWHLYHPECFESMARYAVEASLPAYRND